MINNTILLAIESDKTTTYNIELYDINGRLLKKAKQVAMTGITNVSMDIKEITSHGMGILKISDGTILKTFKVMY